MKATFQSFPSPVTTQLPSLPSCHHWTLNLFRHARLLIPKINSCAHLCPSNTTLTPTAGGILSKKKLGKKMFLRSFPVRHQLDLSTPNPLSLSCLDFFFLLFSHRRARLSTEPFSAKLLSRLPIPKRENKKSSRRRLLVVCLGRSLV